MMFVSWVNLKNVTINYSFCNTYSAIDNMHKNRWFWTVWKLNLNVVFGFKCFVQLDIAILDIPSTEFYFRIVTYSYSWCAFRGKKTKKNMVEIVKPNWKNILISDFNNQCWTKHIIELLDWFNRSCGWLYSHNVKSLWECICLTHEAPNRSFTLFSMSLRCF